MEETNLYPKVSVVTPSYKQGRFIQKTILSVICQDYPNLEYIVVDAVSPDNTTEILERYKKHIDVIIVEPDRGQSDALNKGFKRSTGEVMAYLNSDDCYAGPTVISRAVAALQDHPSIDMVYGQRDSINGAGNFAYAQPYRPFSKENLYLSDYIPQECTFWRRTIFEKAGGCVDESFQFAMDYELWLRFLAHGADFLSVEDVFGLFRTYSQQKSIDQWHSLGLPEIARLYDTYLGRRIPEKEMINYFQEHSYGAHPVDSPEAFQCVHKLWDINMHFKKRSLEHIRLDEWSFAEYERKFGVPLVR